MIHEMKTAPDRIISDNWSMPPVAPVLEENEVHAWIADLDGSQDRVHYYADLLAPEELARADRFYFQRDHNRFILARGMLRAILGLYLKLAPKRISFVYNQQGKPALAENCGERDIRFNVSHSYGLALLGMTERREMGIDIEYIRPDFATEEVAERFFSPREVATLSAMPDSLRAESFFNCWTRKEAYIKAIGLGLSCPLSSFDVSLAPGDPAALLSVRGDAGACARWRMHALDPGVAFKAAIIVEGQGWELKQWRWRP